MKTQTSMVGKNTLTKKHKIRWLRNLPENHIDEKTQTSMVGKNTWMKNTQISMVGKNSQKKSQQKPHGA